MPQPRITGGPRVRGSGRAPSGDTIERLTVTLPAGLVRSLDELVLERKDDVRAFNRSALIQEALVAYLAALEPATHRDRSPQ